MLPKDYQPGQAMSHPKLTWFEMLDESGKIWAMVRVPEHRTGVTVDVNALAGGYVANLHGGVAFTTGRKPQPKRTRDSRLVARMTASLCRHDEWEKVEADLPGDFVGRIEATEASGVVRVTLDCERVRIAILDAAGNPRVVMSEVEEPAAVGERFRSPLRAGEETYLHLLLIDGALPAGKTADYLVP